MGWGFSNFRGVGNNEIRDKRNKGDKRMMERENLVANS